MVSEGKGEGEARRRGRGRTPSEVLDLGDGVLVHSGNLRGLQVGRRQVSSEDTLGREKRRDERWKAWFLEGEWSC